ncbi:MAG: right-handed parallel beta-helix repeat-containing protein [Elusimicrobiota bacterium]
MDWKGEVSGEASWEGDVRVSGDVVVQAGAVLRVRPGARIFFAPRPSWACAVFRAAKEGYPIEASDRESCDLVVLGRLEILGIENQPVLIGADGAPWGGVLWLGRSAGILRGCLIRTQTEYALQSFDDSNVSLEDSRLEQAQVGVAARGLSRVFVRGGQIRASRCAAVSCDGARVRLERSCVAESPQGCSGEGWSLLDMDRVRFEGNRDYAICVRDRAWARFKDCEFKNGDGKIVRQDKARVSG